MMRLLGRFIDLAEAARRGRRRSPSGIAQLACLRPLQRMGEEIGDDELARFAELRGAHRARVRRDSPHAAGEPRDAAHG